MNEEELKNVLEAHKRYLVCAEGGEMANLNGEDLKDADLRGVDLRFAEIRRANLIGANLMLADLRMADFYEADIVMANLSGADLFGAYLNGANLRSARLRDAKLGNAKLGYADLTGANLINADLSGASLADANLKGADLTGANLRGADLIDAKLNGANLSGAKGLMPVIDFMAKNFEKTDKGYVAYKTFNTMYDAPKEWEIKEGAVISENVQFDRCCDCGCGINVATYEWVKARYSTSDIWKVLIRWEWLPGVCVPYNSGGKIRCERVELLEVVE